MSCFDAVELERSRFTYFFCNWHSFFFSATETRKCIIKTYNEITVNVREYYNKEG